MDERINTFMDNANLCSDNSLTHLLDTEYNEQFHSIKHSPYYYADDFIKTFASKQAGFSYLSLNCQSLNAKLSFIKLLIEKFQNNNAPIQALALQETWCSPDSDMSMYQIPGYQLISSGHHASTKGGIAIYLHDNWSYKLINTNQESDLWEMQLIEIFNPNDITCSHIMLGNVYRPPRNIRLELDTFLEEFNVALNEYRPVSSSIYIAGDFNINLLSVNDNPFNSEYFDNILAAGFIPTITLPTRISQNSTLIDNIFTNNLNDITAAILSDHISDHQAVIIIAHENVPSSKNKYITIRTNSEQSQINFHNALKQKNVFDELDKNMNSDPNSNYEIIENTLKETLNECMPTKIVKFNRKKHKKSPWITFGIIRSINNRNKLYKKWKQTKIESENYILTKMHFNKYRNTLRKTIDNAKKMHYKNLFDRFKFNIKKTWSIISDTLNRNKHKLIPETMIIDGRDCSNKQTIADNFNTYFATITEQMIASFPDHETASYADYLNSSIGSRFEFHTINDHMTKCMINNLKTSRSKGHDGITSELLKVINDDICSSITVMINQSLTTGIFPSKLKIAKITPIHKKGGKNIIGNYRPISVLPVISKIFETTISDQITRYFKINSIFCPQQYGYRQNSSTELAALDLIDRVVGQLNDKYIPINFYLDLSKAFDSIDHTILLSKLTYYGFNDMAIKLIKDYLYGRYQYVQIDELLSHKLPIKVGVPQGSILGPLLFNIFINDITYSSAKFNFIMYADDTTLNSTLESFGNINNTAYIQTAINNELDKIVKWLDLNKLCLNVSKSRFMLFHKPPKVIPQLEFCVKQNIIEYVENFTFLGLTIDCQLTWKNHINLISLKISRVIGILQKLKYMFPSCILKTLYSSLIFSQMNYGLLAWGTKSDKIVMQQKRAIRIVNLERPTAHTEPLLKSMNQLKLMDLYKTKLLTMYYKLYRNQLPQYFEQFLPQYGTSRYPLRYDGLHMPQATREFCTVNAKYQMHKLIREISHPSNVNDRPFPGIHNDQSIENLILSLSQSQFTNYVKLAYIQSYVMTCDIQNCIIVGQICVEYQKDCAFCDKSTKFGTNIA